MATKNHHTRRTFIGFGIAASAGIATRSRAQSPNEKLNIAIIGTGGRGGANTGGVKGEAIYALCDTNPSALSAAKKRFPAAKTTSDWREVVDDPAIDAVVVSTADACATACCAARAQGCLFFTLNAGSGARDCYLKSARTHRHKVAVNIGLP